MFEGNSDTNTNNIIKVNKENIAHIELEEHCEPREGEKLSDTQRARAERNRQRARTLREASLAHRPQINQVSERVASRAVDTGGGFLLDEEEAPGAGEWKAVSGAQPPAPLVHRSQQPHCLECHHPFPQSYLFDTFDYSVCDQCRDDEDKHSLITRTEAKSEFLLKDCDLDSRPPPLRCVRRRNPHRARFGDMRLYLRAQVEARALEAWGSLEALRAERAARRERRQRAGDTATRRRLRALRMDVRSSLFDRTRAAHQHEFGPERRVPGEDVYERACACGHVQTYEKM